jgi:hypothetical protein
MSPTIRLLCALLTLALALPAAQARACAPDAAPAGHGAHVMVAGHGHTDHRAPAHQAPARPLHDCMGCIAPIDVGFYRPVDAPVMAALRLSGPAPTPALIHHVAAPEPPPPRVAV